MAIQKPINSPESTKETILKQIPTLLDFVNTEAQSVLLWRESEKKSLLETLKSEVHKIRNELWYRGERWGNYEERLTLSNAFVEKKIKKCLKLYPQLILLQEQLLELFTDAQDNELMRQYIYWTFIVPITFDMIGMTHSDYIYDDWEDLMFDLCQELILQSQDLGKIESIVFSWFHGKTTVQWLKTVFSRLINTHTISFKSTPFWWYPLEELKAIFEPLSESKHLRNFKYDDQGTYVSFEKRKLIFSYLSMIDWLQHITWKQSDDENDVLEETRDLFKDISHLPCIQSVDIQISKEHTGLSKEDRLSRESKESLKSLFQLYVDFLPQVKKIRLRSYDFPGTYPEDIIEIFSVFNNHPNLQLLTMEIYGKDKAIVRSIIAKTLPKVCVYYIISF
jgi:hypothetical protein